jgi:hypothetical protein
MSFNFSWSWTAFVGPKDISNPKSPYYVPPSSIGSALPPKDPEAVAAAAAAAAAAEEEAARNRKASIATTSSGYSTTPRLTHRRTTPGSKPGSRHGGRRPQAAAGGNVLESSLEGHGRLGPGGVPLVPGGLLDDSEDGWGGVAGLASSAPAYVHAKGLVPWGYAAHLRALYIAHADEYVQAHPRPPPQALPLPSTVKATRVDPQIPKYLRFRSTMDNPVDLPAFLAGVTVTSTMSSTVSGGAGRARGPVGAIMAPRVPKEVGPRCSALDTAPSTRLT